MISVPSQLALDLQPASRRGGRRAGAGRKPGPRPRVPHLRRDALSKQTPCHVTLRVRRDVPSLRKGRFVRAVERSFREACERGEFRLVRYSIQRDHLHLLVEAEGAAALGRGMKSVGARIARAVHRIFARRGAVLADRYHHRVLRTPREVRNALAYVLLNARKHGAALGMRLTDAIDPASSGRWFQGWTRPPTQSGEGAPVAHARSWLLRLGWWRHGRIDPREVPGRHR